MTELKSYCLLTMRCRLFTLTVLVRAHTSHLIFSFNLVDQFFHVPFEVFDVVEDYSKVAVSIVIDLNLLKCLLVHKKFEQGLNGFEAL